MKASVFYQTYVEKLEFFRLQFIRAIEALKQIVNGVCKSLISLIQHQRSLISS